MTLKFLLLTRTYPYPADAGDLRYTVGLIESLGALPTISLTVFCGSSLPAVYSDGPVLWIGSLDSPQLMTDISSIFSRYPRGAVRAFSSKSSLQLKRLIASENFDFIFINEAVCAKAVPSLALLKTPILYVSHNVESDIRPKIAEKISNPLRRWLQRYDAGKYRRMELWLLKNIAGLIAITEKDCARYEQLSPDLPILILKPGYSKENMVLPPTSMPATSKAILIGSFEWSAKQLNLKMILNAYRSFSPHSGEKFSLRIAGKMPPAFLAELRQAHAEVEFIGDFEQLSDVIKGASVGLLLEDLGGGFKLKTLDYIFNGLAIVGLPQAMSGSDLRPDEDYIEVDSIETAMPVIAALLKDHSRIKQVAGSARHRSEGQYDWSDRAQRLVEFIEPLKAFDPKSDNLRPLPSHPTNTRPKVDIDRI